MKTALTVFHCLMALVVTNFGLRLAAGQADEHPVQSLLIALAAVVLPVLIATRISWRAGFDAGRRSRAATPS